MNYFYNKEIIFPHVNSHKQRKEVSFVYCYNIRLVDYRKKDDSGFSNYVKSLIRFTQMTFENNLVRQEHGDVNLKVKMKDTLFRTDGGNSAVVDIQYISNKEKNDIDDYLIMSGWGKKLDKYSFVFEGCPNDEKVYIGGKKEMMLHYCKLFPMASNCVELKKKFDINQSDRKLNMIFEDPEVADKVMDGVVRFFDKEA